MTGPEALQALREGKKIKRQYWDEGVHANAVCFYGEGCILYGTDEWNPNSIDWIDDAGVVLSSYAKGIFLSELLMYDDWEVVK